MSGNGTILSNLQNMLAIFPSSTLSSMPIEEQKKWETEANYAAKNNTPYFYPVLNTNEQVLFYEGLGNSKDKDGIPLKNNLLFQFLYKCLSPEKVDLDICDKYLEHAIQQDCLPVSINVALSSTLNPSFCTKVSKLAQKYSLDPKEHIYLEILEGPIPNDAKIENLQNLVDANFNITLDDLNYDKNGLDSIKTLGPYANVFKLDKKTVRGFLEQVKSDSLSQKELENTDLIKLLDYLNEHIGINDDIKIIAEHVHDYEELTILAKYGIDGFQGEYANKKAPATGLDSLENRFLTCEYE